MFSSSYFLVDTIGLATALAILCSDVFHSRLSAPYTKYFRILLMCICLLFACLFLPVCGALVEAVHSGTAWTWPFAVLSLLLIYMNVQQEHITDEKLRAAALETKLAESRTAIMLSQIQPHRR